MSLYSFTGQNGQDPSAQAGLQQYIQQGAAQINPGAAQVAASNPIKLAAGMGMGQANQLAGQGLPPPSTPQGQAAAYNTMGQGAQMQPNIGGQNMGGVGPTIQNSQALQNPNYQQQLAAMLQGSS